MSTKALNIYAGHLAAQLGEDGVFTQEAKYDPTGSNVSLYGIFDDNTNRSNKDGANVYQKIESSRFILSSILDFDIYQDKNLYIVSEDRTFTIEMIEKDKYGVQVLWLV